MAALVVLALYVAGVPRNPPGFFIDEVSIGYNALTIAQSGVDEHGQRFPLFFRAFGEYKNPVYIYALAAIYLVTGPGILVARLLSALCGVAAVLVLGRLAWVQTRDGLVTLLTIGAAALTPGLFELSRLVFEVAAFPLAVGLFLLAAWRAFEGRPNVAALVAALVLVTYTYTAGRILGPVFAVLLAFFFSRKIVLVWVLFALTLIPIFVVNSRTGGALTSRRGVTVEENRAATIGTNFFANLSPAGLLLDGDPNPRHHVPGSGGPVLAGTFLLALVAMVAGRRDRWVQFLFAGTLASALPAALTLDVGHALRLSALFVFVIALSIWAMARFGHGLKPLAAFLILVQAAIFFHAFHTRGADRRDDFDADVQAVIVDALNRGERPVYVDRDGAIFGFWYAALRGEGRDAFKILEPWEKPPRGAIYVGGAEPRPYSVVIGRHGPYGVHRINPE